MKIRTGYTIAYDTFGPTPMSLLLCIRPERQADLITPEIITFDPPVEAQRHDDGFGNVCIRIVAPGRSPRDCSPGILNSGGAEASAG